ncbi:tubulin-tyrosine ligase family protein, putative, partial [Ichthyophthirius multifiliis]
ISSFSIQAIFQEKYNLYNQFHMFGADFMIDQNSNVSLIEMNSNPYLLNSTDVHIKVVPDIIQSFLDISTEIFKQNELQ